MTKPPVLTAGLLAALVFSACDKLPIQGSSPTRHSDAAAAAAGPWSVVADTDRAYGKVIWDGQRFLACCGSNILSSPDGITWTPANPGISKNLWGLASNGTLIVAVGTEGGIATSADGVRWTARTSGVPGRIFTVLWANGQFYAYGDGGMVLTSPDGAVWTPQLTPGPYGFHHGVFTGKDFVVTADKGIAVSPDGLRFSMARSTNNRQMDVAWNGSNFVSVGSGGDLTMLVSPDGRTWNQVKPPTSAGLNMIVWTGQHFVAAGLGGVVLTSPDAITWTSHTVGMPEDLSGIAWNGQMLVATTSTGKILASTASPRVKLR